MAAVRLFVRVVTPKAELTTPTSDTIPMASTVKAATSSIRVNPASSDRTAGSSCRALHAICSVVGMEWGVPLGPFTCHGPDGPLAHPHAPWPEWSGVDAVAGEHVGRVRKDDLQRRDDLRIG